jgi:hypothetical protein
MLISSTQIYPYEMRIHVCPKMIVGCYTKMVPVVHLVQHHNLG